MFFQVTVCCVILFVLARIFSDSVLGTKSITCDPSDEQMGGTNHRLNDFHPVESDHLQSLYYTWISQRVCNMNDT